MFVTRCCWLKHEQIVQVRGCQACLPCLSITPLTQRLFPPEASGPASAVTQLVDDPDHHKWHPGTLRKVETGPDFILNVLQLSSYFVNIWVIPVAGPEKSELIGNNDFHRWCSSVFQTEPCVVSGSWWLGLVASLPWKRNLGNEAELNSPSVSASCLLWSVSGALGFLLAVVSCTWSRSTMNACNSIAGTGQDMFRFSKVHNQML